MGDHFGDAAAIASSTPTISLLSGRTVMKQRAIVPIGILVALGVASPAVAEEGDWHGKSVLVTIDRTSKQLTDRANHAVAIYEWDGAVYNGDNKAFLDKAQYHVVGLVDTGVQAGGYKTFTEADGSKVFAKYVVTQPSPRGADGKFEFTGGTGKYEGITGNGTFHFVMLTDRTAVDELAGHYNIPDRMVGSSSK
jgi:hypothetical protein